MKRILLLFIILLPLVPITADLRLQIKQHGLRTGLKLSFSKSFMQVLLSSSMTWLSWLCVGAWIVVFIAYMVLEQ
jgi:hypothetical protein